MPLSFHFFCIIIFIEPKTKKEIAMYLKLEELSTEQKLGMLLCARRLHNEDGLEETLELIKKRAVGCVQIPLSGKMPEIVKAIREVADYPILMINDMEQGYPRCDIPKIPAMTLAACNNKEYFRAFARGIVASAQADGVSGTWCPVLDIPRVDSPCKMQRVFGNTPERVLAATEEICRVFAEHGYVATGKHYPGGKDNPYDSHMTPSPTYTTEEQIKKRSFIP